MLKYIKNRLCRNFCPKKKPREIVIVYPFNTNTQELFLIQEHIHHYKKSFWKFVSGGIDKSGKSNREHAIEELAEEVAMQSNNVYHIYSAPKIFGNRGTHFYVAENPTILETAPENPDSDIIVDTKWVHQTEFQRMLDDRELLWDEATMCALQVFNTYK